MNVTRENRVVKKTVVVEETEQVFTLELNREEACALMAVCGRIIGSTEKNSLRDTVTSPLWKELNKSISFYDPDVQKYADTVVQKMEIR